MTLPGIISAIGEAISAGRAAAAAEVFGPEGAAAWGARTADDEAEDELAKLKDKVTESADGNSTFTITDPEALRKLLWSPEMIESVTRAGQRVADMANELAEIEGAEYRCIVQAEDESYPTPRAIVVAHNKKAKLDEAAHGTLAKAMASAPHTMEADLVEVTW